jgi:hypothetical protein
MKGQDMSIRELEDSKEKQTNRVNTAVLGRSRRGGLGDSDAEGGRSAGLASLLGCRTTSRVPDDEADSE